jgi:hypothetical protein
MMSTFDPTIPLTLLTHPFQVALIVVTCGALLRHVVRAVIRHHSDVVEKTRVAVANVRTAA